MHILSYEKRGLILEQKDPRTPKVCEFKRKREISKILINFGNKVTMQANEFDGNAAFAGGGFMPSQATQTAHDRPSSSSKV